VADVRAVLLQALYFMRNLAVQVVEKIALMPQAGDVKASISVC
jgi:hypothetical protein